MRRPRRWPRRRRAAGHRRATRPWWWGGSIPSSTRRPRQAAFEQLAKAIPGCVALHAPLPAASRLYARLLDRLIVLDDLDHVAGAHALRLGAAAAGPRQARRHAGRLDRPALGRAGGDRPARLPHRGRGVAASGARPRRAGQRDLPDRLRPDGRRRTDDPAEPLADRRADELRPGPRVRPGAAAHHAGRRLAAGRAGRGRLAAEPRGRAARQAGDGRRAAAGEPSVLLGRLHAGRRRRGVAPPSRPSPEPVKPEPAQTRRQ